MSRLRGSCLGDEDKRVPRATLSGWGNVARNRSTGREISFSAATRGGFRPLPRPSFARGVRQVSFPQIVSGFPLKSAAHRDKSREWGRLKAKVEPLLTLGNSEFRGGEGQGRGRANMAHIRQSRPDSSLVFQVKVLNPFMLAPLRSEGERAETASGVPRS